MVCLLNSQPPAANADEPVPEAGKRPGDPTRRLDAPPCDVPQLRQRLLHLILKREAERKAQRGP